MRIAAVVQARASSRRLPGKVLRPLAGKPLLAHLLERLAHAPGLDGIILATSKSSEDDPVAELAASCGAQCHRGPLDDVLGRFLETAETFDLDAIVRISGDSPLMDPSLVGQAAALFRSGSWDLVTNVFPRSFPKGQSVEVIGAEVLRRISDMTANPQDREHVTRGIYARAAQFRIRNIALDPPRPELKLSVDTPEDLARIETILEFDPVHVAAGGVRELIATADSLFAPSHTA